MSIPIGIDLSPIRRIDDFQLTEMSLEDYENNVFNEFFHTNRLRSRAVYHISISPYKEYLQIIFRHRDPNHKKVLYKYPLQAPLTFIHTFENKVLQLDSLGDAVSLFKRTFLSRFEKYHL